MNGRCPGDGDDAAICWFPAASCPYHAARPLPEEAEPVDWGDEDVHALAYGALRAAIHDGATPLQLNRFMRSVRIVDALGPPPLDEERALAQASLRGILMNGLAPRTEDEWELAREMFDDDTMEDLYQRLEIEIRLAPHGDTRFVPEWAPIERT